MAQPATLNTPTKDQLSSLLKICTAVIDTVRETGSKGAPRGVVFAALQMQGCSLSQFNSLMSMLVSAKKIREEGLLLFAV